MKYAVLLTTAIIVASSPAFAHDSHNQDDGNTNVRATSDAYSRSDSRAQSRSASQSDNSVSYNDRNPVSAAFAAPLAVGSQDCMGSSSGGGSVPSFSLSLGTTWHDEACERRYNAAIMHDLGHDRIAIAVMCEDETIAAADALTEHLCPRKSAQAGHTESTHDEAAFPTADKAMNR